MLAEYNPNLDIQDNEGNTPLHLAVRNGNDLILQALLAHGADINAYNNNGDTALHVAIRAGRTTVASQLLEAGAQINERNDEGNTPSHYAARAGRLDAVRILLAHNNVQVNLLNRQHASAWMLAMQNNHPEAACLLGRFVGQAVFGGVSRVGHEGEFAWSPLQEGHPLPLEIAALIANFAVDPRLFAYARSNPNSNS